MNRQSSVHGTCLAPLSAGSIHSFQLRGTSLISRLFGLFPVQNIHLADVQFLRLATKDEVPALYFLFNWMQFLSYKRARRPVYILQTNGRSRLFLKLEGDAHFRLRQAIARNQRMDQRVAA